MISAGAVEERGQALVVVAGAMAVLIAALVFSVEWGYGFAERRSAQNDADAAALAVGRHLASTFVAANSPFASTADQLCFDAARFVEAGVSEVLTVSFQDESQNVVTVIGAPGEPVPAVFSTSNCAAVAGVQLPASAVFVHVRAVRTYSRAFGGVIGRESGDAGASARSRLTSAALLRPLQLPLDPECRGCVAGNGVSGLSTAPSVAIWPLVRFFDPHEFAGVPCGAYCDRSSVSPIRLLDRSGPSSTFSGIIAPTHDTTRGSGGISNQVVTESDWSASTPARHSHPDTSNLQTHGQPESGCNPVWNSMGTADLLTAAHCDVPNWFWYGYRGSLSLSTDWTSAVPGTWRNYLDSAWIPTALPLGAARYSCLDVPSYFPTPSCSAQVGDWVETVNGKVACDTDSDCQDDGEKLGDLTATMVVNIRHFIAQYGRELPSSPGVKAVVINVFLWDCADKFSPSTGIAGTWSRASDPSCGRITVPDTLRRIGRVHLVTVVPFTVYDDGVTSDHVDAYWGNAFGDAGPCQQSWNTVPTPSACLLNPLMNSAFLVPDE